MTSDNDSNAEYIQHLEQKLSRLEFQNKQLLDKIRKQVTIIDDLRQENRQLKRQIDPNFEKDPNAPKISLAKSPPQEPNLNANQTNQNDQIRNETPTCENVNQSPVQSPHSKQPNVTEKSKSPPPVPSKPKSPSQANHQPNISGKSKPPPSPVKSQDKPSIPVKSESKPPIPSKLESKPPVPSKQDSKPPIPSKSESKPPVPAKPKPNSQPSLPSKAPHQDKPSSPSQNPIPSRPAPSPPRKPTIDVEQNDTQAQDSPPPVPSDQLQNIIGEMRKKVQMKKVRNSPVQENEDSSDGSDSVNHSRRTTAELQAEMKNSLFKSGSRNSEDSNNEELSLPQRFSQDRYSSAMIMNQKDQPNTEDDSNSKEFVPSGNAFIDEMRRRQLERQRLLQSTTRSIQKPPPPVRPSLSGSNSSPRLDSSGNPSPSPRLTASGNSSPRVAASGNSSPSRLADSESEFRPRSFTRGGSVPIMITPMPPKSLRSSEEQSNSIERTSNSDEKTYSNEQTPIQEKRASIGPGFMGRGAGMGVNPLLAELRERQLRKQQGT